MTKLWNFRGGLRLKGHKTLTNQEAIGTPALPERLFVPLQQHIGTISEPIVKVGDNVLNGQCLATYKGAISSAQHAPASGTIRSIGPQAVIHPAELPNLCIEIELDGQTDTVDPEPIPDWHNSDPSLLLEKICQYGIVGMGGAGFPSRTKLSAHQVSVIDTLILNGAECEPYITCDDRLMQTQPRAIISGLNIMRYILRASGHIQMRCIIGIEANKPQALAAMQSAAKNEDIEVVSVPALYPAGGEKQLIRTLTGKEVPSGSLPSHVGVICQNVATAFAVYEAIIQGKPLTSRLLTVTGNLPQNPGNLHALIGTPIQHLLQQCDTDTDKMASLIVGGPMMGIELHNPLLPITKTTNCLIANGPIVTEPPTTLPCIRCGACATACPINLLPQQLYWHARAHDFDKTQDYHLFDCIECGCCAYVCPSHIPLVHYYRFAKTQIWTLERDRRKSDIARDRHDQREQRLESEKRARKEKLKNRKKKNPKSGADKKATIEAALARVRDKKKASQVEKKNTDNLNSSQQKQIDEADNRRQD